MIFISVTLKDDNDDDGAGEEEKKRGHIGMHKISFKPMRCK